MKIVTGADGKSVLRISKTDLDVILKKTDLKKIAARITDNLVVQFGGQENGKIAISIKNDNGEWIFVGQETDPESFGKMMANIARVYISEEENRPVREVI